MKTEAYERAIMRTDAEYAELSQTFPRTDKQKFCSFMDAVANELEAMIADHGGCACNLKET